MTDWVDRSEIRNYSIKRETDRRNLIELLLIPLGALVIGGVFIFYGWERSQLIDMGYDSQQLLEFEQSLLRVEKSLVLEEAVLKDPKRIDGIAREMLGLSPLRPHQVRLARFQELGSNTSPTLALAETSEAGSALKTTSATN